jgi:hypothetical protein
MCLWVAQVPSAVNTTISVSVVKKRLVGDSRYERANHIAVASTAPAVPGPHGQKPAPNPVARTTASIELRFILGCKITYFILNNAVNGQKKLFSIKKFSKKDCFLQQISNFAH